MRKWVTELHAIDPITGDIKRWLGPYVLAPTEELAQRWCETNCGYLKVIGELVSSMPTKGDEFTPDWANKVDYETISNN